MESISIANKNLQDPTRFYGILDALESILLEDPARSYKILQHPTRFYGTRKKMLNGIHT